ncbi:right-handed parallel beta-helix repeat-containing protein [Thalassoglobus sp.]|uniref:right-handed parallel beta-helix repeat-containing protein n=1 Tax=Thalassoglobus sp. TaxID=2795869 RepID=UPI003AA96C94
MRRFATFISLNHSRLFTCLCMGMIISGIAVCTSEAQEASTIPKLVGDGTTDNTAVINQWISEKKAPLTFPKGVFRITKTIEIDLDKTGPISISGDGTATILMDGPGPAFRFIGTHEGTAAPATVKENVWKNQRTPMVEGVEILGNHPEANGIEATGTMQITITRVVLRKLHHGIHLVKRNRNVLIADCHIYENSGVGIFYDKVNLHQSNIIGCHISYNKLGGIVNKGGDVRNIHIGTCDIEGNMGGPDSTPSANIELDSRGGSVAEVAIVGCTIQHDHNSPNSANIRYHGESTPRPFTDETRHGHLTIADNVLSDVFVNIEITNARSVAITGNTVWKGYEHNLKITGSESVVVTGNMFDRNPRYHYGDGALSKNAILIENSTGVTFSANHITGVIFGKAAVNVQNCKRVNISNCTILDCALHGVLLEKTTESRISDCLIKGDELVSAVKEIAGKDNFVATELRPETK